MPATIINLKCLDQPDIHERVFFEMGALDGNGIQVALDAGYKQVISVEIVEKFYNHCVERFKLEIEEGLVEIIHGDANKAVAVGHLIDEPMTFYIDAHFDTDHLDIYKEENPGTTISASPFIMETVNNIMALKRKQNDTIIIDDFDDIMMHNNCWAVGMTEPRDMSHVYKLIKMTYPDKEVAEIIMSGKRKHDVLAYKVMSK